MSSESSKLPLEWHKRRLSKDMSQKAELVLNIVKTFQEPLYIMELMNVAQKSKIGSMVSCHTALNWLIEHGYVKSGSSKLDKRVKHIEITKKGEGYFA